MRRIPFTKLAEFTRGEKLDEVQTRLLQELDQYLNQITAKDDLSERSLRGVHMALATLIDWQTRTLRGRAMMRRRILKQIQQRELQINHYEQWCEDWMLNEKAQALFDQWLADKAAEKRAKAGRQAEDNAKEDTHTEEQHTEDRRSDVYAKMLLEAPRMDDDAPTDTSLTDAIDAWLLTVDTERGAM